MSNIAVIGAGYVGLTTAACFASIGHTVTCADIDADRIDALSQGVVPIVEAGLAELVRAGLDSGRLTFVVGAAAAVADCEFAYLCVPTPQSPDGSADLSYIRSAAAEIGPLLPTEAIVVNKSTVPVGSTRVVEEVLGRDDVRVVSNPEFLREGSAVHDFLNPDRVVIGSDDQAAAFRVASLFDPLRAQLLITDPASAETIKYASNAFLAAKVSFVNAIANVCEAVGADVRDVLMGMSYDKRIGSEFMRPGPGFGGSCFPKDTAALIRIAADAGYDFGLLRGVTEVNTAQFERVVTKVETAAGGALDGVTVAAWGLTFKARTDDLRMSPSLEVIGRLLARGGRVRAYDPAIAGRVGPPIAGRDRRLRRPLRPVRGGGGAGGAHRVGRLPAGRPHQGGRPPATPAASGRRPQPPRPRRAAQTRVPVHRDRPLMTAASSGRRVVVTGGAGFLGSHLCRELMARGDEVVAVDNLLTGRRENLDDLFGRPGFMFQLHDVSNFVHVAGPVDAVLHFASPASPVDYLLHPIPTLKVGSLGTHNTLGLALHKGARYLLASTSEVYGDPLVHPQTEDYWGNVNPIGPRGVYDEAKRFAEAMATAYQRYHGLDVRIVRIFNTYGPRMRPDDGRVVSNFLTQALDGKPLTIYGDGSQTRSFCYVDDLVRGLLALLDSDHVGPVNIGNPDEYTLLAAGRGRPRDHRLVVGAGLRAPSRRRPQGAPARHQPGPPGAGLGARGRPAPGPGPHRRVVPPWSLLTPPGPASARSSSTSTPGPTWSSACAACGPTASTRSWWSTTPRPTGRRRRWPSPTPTAGSCPPAPTSGSAPRPTWGWPTPPPPTSSSSTRTRSCSRGPPRPWPPPSTTTPGWPWSDRGSTTPTAACTPPPAASRG